MMGPSTASVTLIDIVFIALLFLGVLCCGAIGIFRILVSSGDIARNKGFWFALILCFAAFIFRLEAPSKIHVDFYGYSTVAQNIFYHGLAASTIKGSVLCPEAYSLPWRPLGYAFLLVLGYCLTGHTVQAPFLINILFGFLSVGVVYRIAWLIYRDNVIVACSAAVLAFLPLHIEFSGVLTPDIPGFFFFLMSIMFFGEWFSRRWMILVYAAIFSGCYSVYIKPEYGILFLAEVFLFLRIVGKRSVLEAKQRNEIIYICACLLLPLAIMIPRFIAGECMNANGAFFSLEHMKDHLWPNVTYLFNNNLGWISSGLFLLGCTNILLKSRDKIGLWLLTWYLFGLLLLSGYFAGCMVERDLGRHFLFIALPFILIAGWGWGSILCQFRYKAVFTVICLAVFFVNCDNLVHQWEDSRGRQVAIMGNGLMRQQWEFYRRVSLKIPGDAYIICPSFPWQLLIYKTNKVLLASLFTNGDMPHRVVYLKGINYFGDQEDVYRQILTFYRCQSILKMPVTGPSSVLEADFCERSR